MNPRPTDRDPVHILLSAAPRDQAFVKAFRAHLANLENAGLILVSETIVPPGADAGRWLDQALAGSEVFLPLVSADHLTGDPYGLLARALDRRSQGTLHVWPLLVRHCGWTTSTGAEIAPLRQGRPIEKPANDKGWLESVKDIEALARGMRPRKEPPAAKGAAAETPSRQAEPTTGAEPVRRSASAVGNEVESEKFAALKMRVEEALKRSPPLVAALLDKGYFVADQPHPARSVALALFGAPARQVARDLAVFTKEVEYREAARAVFWLLLPIAGDWEDVLQQAQRVEDRGTLVLRLATATVAEIVIARTEERCCLFAPDDEIPQGANHVPLPATAHAPLLDVRGKGLVESVLMNLWRPPENHVPGEEVWRSLRRACATPERFLPTAAARINQDAALASRRYLLFIDDDLGALEDELDSSWARAQEALFASLPGLRLVRLRGRQAEYEDEIQLYPFVRHVRDLP